jgi:parvulin-like peptidyl-prolyl isomerase
MPACQPFSFLKISKRPVGLGHLTSRASGLISERKHNNAACQTLHGGAFEIPQTSIFTVSEIPSMENSFLKTRNWFVASGVLAVFSLGIFQSASSLHAQEVLDGLAAVVNNTPVTFSQVRELVASRERAAAEQFQGAALNEKIKQIRTEAIEELIDRQLILQYFKEKGFQLPPYLIEDRIATVIREEHNGDRTAFARKLASFGYTIERFRKEEMDKIIVQSMRQQAVKAPSSVSQDKVKAFYKEHVKEFTTEEQIHLRMIILRSSEKGSPEQRKKFLEEVRTKVAGGAKFSEMAKLYSEDNTAESGGDWGWVSPGTLHDTLAKAASDLKTGQVSKPILMGDSAYLLYCDEKKPKAVLSFEESRDTIEKVLLSKERQKAQEEWIAKLRKKAYIKVF